MRSQGQKTLDDLSEEKIVTRLAITYGILRRLGFSEERVQECLNTIPGVELDEAYEWVSQIPYGRVLLSPGCR